MDKGNIRKAMSIPEGLQEAFKKLPGKVFYEKNMKNLNWFNTGGPAQIFFIPSKLEELIFFLKKLSNTLPIKVLGVGSNILIRDGGYKGVIIKLGKNFSHISKLDNNTLISGASVLDRNLSRYALDNSIGGLEFLSCIPGSVGGAIRMNSGCYGHDISKKIVSIQVIDSNGNIKSMKAENIKFSYRGSDLPNDLIFLSATFKGENQDKNKIKQIMEKFSTDKKNTQPSKIKTCGSTFKNPISQTKKRAWELIKEANCSGLKVGGATISEKHCNFFVNSGAATSNDMENLISLVKEKVLKETGINLELELQIIGEKK